MREAALQHPGWYPEPAPERRQSGKAAELCRESGRVEAEIREHGFVLVDLDRGLTPAEIMRLGRKFGELMPEHDDAIASFVTDGVVLDLPTVHGPEIGMSLEPFSSGPLRVHTEASVRPVHEQPWLIMLACQASGKNDEGLQTIVIPAAGVIASLSVYDKRVLARIRVDRRGAPPVLCKEDGRLVLRIRDFGEPIPWIGEVGSADVVQDVLDRLWEAVYDQRRIRGIGWSGPSVAVLDNTRFLHGRTGASSSAGYSRRLRRVRILRGDVQKPPDRP